MSAADEPTVQVIAAVPVKRPGPLTRLRIMLHGGPAKLTLALLMAIALSALLWTTRELIFSFWLGTLEWCLRWLQHEGLQVTNLNLLLPQLRDLQSPAIRLHVDSPQTIDYVAHLVTALLIYLLAAMLLPTPWRGAVRALALLHAAGTALTAGLQIFPYEVDDHTRALSVFTLMMLAALPVVMAATHSIVERSHERRALATLLIAAWLITSLPFKLIAHALLIQAFSPLIMPLLFIAAGPAFDILVVTALYAWAVSWRHGS